LTWIKQEERWTAGKRETRTRYFDFENEWAIKSSLTQDMQVDGCKHLETELEVAMDQELKAPYSGIGPEEFSKLNLSHVEKDLSYG